MKISANVTKTFKASTGKTTFLMALFIVAFLIAFICFPGGTVANAEGGEGGTAGAGAEPALTVSVDGEVAGEFTLGELEQIAEDEGNKTYNYSSWNVFPTFSTTTDIHGPTVDGILKSAGVRSSVKSTGTVTFTSQGGYYQVLTGKQLFEEKRFYYPNGDSVRREEGMIPEDAAYEGREEMPAVISTEQKDEYKLFVGQVAPNEQNNPLFVKQLANGGRIDISTKAAEKCSDVKVDPVGATLWKDNKEVTLTSNNNYEYDKIYFTFDRSKTPDYGSAIYNYGPKQDLECKPVISGNGEDQLLKVVVKGYGKQDSNISRFTYYTGDMLTVKVDGQIKKSYGYMDDFKSLPDTGEVRYSGYNSFPSYSFYNVDSAVDVADIIRDATGQEPESFGSGSRIVFTGKDGYSAEFTVQQLFVRDRYFYPEMTAGTDLKGGAAEPEAYEGAVIVPAVIELTGKTSLRIGQLAPNDQNYPECVDHMLVNGEINIITEEADKCEPVSEITPQSRSCVSSGTKLQFPELTRDERRNKVFYIVDPEEGEIPDYGSDFYHYSPYNWPQKLFNPPVLSGGGKHTVAVKVCAYGKRDSEVTYFDYYVLDPPAGLKASATSYNTIKLTWKKAPGASEYILYRREGSGSFKQYKTLSSETLSFTDKNLRTGTSYSYKLLSAADDEDLGNVKSGYSGTVSAKPALKTASVKLSAGKRKITIKWNKVSGANGYVIYRSTKKSSGFKKIKTITKGSTRSFVNKKLKKGKKFYYKIRAYRTVSGKKVYSGYSSVKSAKVR